MKISKIILIYIIKATQIKYFTVRYDMCAGELASYKMKCLHMYMQCCVSGTQISCKYKTLFHLTCLVCSVCHKLELERQQHNQLKHTWQRANDQFLESQRLLMRDMQRIESVLSSEQLRQVEEKKKKDQVHTQYSLCFIASSLPCLR